MTVKVGLQRPTTRVVSDECILPNPCRFPAVILREIGNISTERSKETES
jgi:hypothetical protein